MKFLCETLILGKVAMVLNQLAIVVCNCNILKWALILLIGFHPILLSFLGGADNNKTFLQSLEGFRAHVPALGHSPFLSAFEKKHPFGSENLAVATLNLHGVSLPDVYQNADFCWQTQYWKNTTVFGWRKKKCLVSKTKNRKHYGKLRIPSPPFRDWQMSAYDRGSDVGLTFFAMCSAPCLPHVLHSFQRLFCEVFGILHCFCTKPKLCELQPLWSYITQVENIMLKGKGAVSTNGWPTSPSQQSPGHCRTKIRKIPGTKPTQKITG